MTLDDILNKFARDLFTKTTELDLIQMVRPVTDADRRKWRDGIIEESKAAIIAHFKALVPMNATLGNPHGEGWNQCRDATLEAFEKESTSSADQS